MRRIHFGGYVIEIDHQRDTLTLRAMGLNLFFVIAMGSLFAVVGLALIYGVFQGEPGIPRKDWTTPIWWAFMALYAFVLVVGLIMAVSGASVIVSAIWAVATGRQTQVLDRREGRCREGPVTLFELDRVVSIGLEYLEPGGEDIHAGIRFVLKDASPHLWLASFPVSRHQCSCLVRETASFLSVTIDGEEDSHGNS